MMKHSMKSFCRQRFLNSDRTWGDCPDSHNGRGIKTILLFLLIVIGIFCRSALARTDTYVFDPNQSTVLQTGGIAGLNRIYTIEGQFQLSVDLDAGTASFIRVDANATDDSPYKRTLDPNEVFSMTSLAGIVTVDSQLEFTGYSVDGSSILLEMTIAHDIIHMKAQTIPPPTRAD